MMMGVDGEDLMEEGGGKGDGGDGVEGEWDVLSTGKQPTQSSSGEMVVDSTREMGWGTRMALKIGYLRGGDRMVVSQWMNGERMEGCRWARASVDILYIATVVHMWRETGVSVE